MTLIDDEIFQLRLQLARVSMDSRRTFLNIFIGLRIKFNKYHLFH